MQLNQNSFIIEDFFAKHVKIVQEQNKYLTYSIPPEVLKFILMKIPEYLANTEYAIEFLIRSDKNDDSFESLQKQLLTYQTLAKNRITNINDQTDSFSINPIESVRIPNHLQFNSATLIYSYSALIMISRKFLDDSTNPSRTDEDFDMNDVIDIFQLYSQQSNFTPFNPKPIQNSEGDENNFLFLGFPSGSQNIHQKGIVSNGNFLFVLHSDMYLSIFPILPENGGFLAPIMCKLKLTPEEVSASISIVKNNLNIIVKNQILSFQIDHKDSKTQEILITDKCANKESILFSVSDGVVNVNISKENGMVFATVKTVDSQKNISKVDLHANLKRMELYQTFQLDNIHNLLTWPAETNGIVLTFYVKIDQNRTLCRQFSLFDGCHINDILLESNVNIKAITYDSINQMHYVAFEKNGQLMVRGFSGSSNCSINPLIYGFSIPDLNFKENRFNKIISLLKNPKQQKEINATKDEKYFIFFFSRVLFESIFFKKDINTFIISKEESHNIFLMPILITEILQILKEVHSDNDKEINLIKNSQIASIQILAVLFVINMRHLCSSMNENESDTNNLKAKFEACIVDLFNELSKFKEEFAMNIISYILLNTMDLIDINGIKGKNNNSIFFQLIIEGLFLDSSPSLSKYMIHVFFMNSDIFSMISFINSSTVFYRYIGDSFPLSKVHPNILLFLISHQRCIINQVHISMEKETFSDFFNVDNKTDNQSLNNFTNYSNFLVDQFTTSSYNCNSLQEFKGTTIYFLFNNYLKLISGLYKYHEIAQTITVHLYVIQNTLKLLFERLKVTFVKNSSALELLTNSALAFGAFTGTLIKGGNYSQFDEKNKWLIRPNMNLISHPELLYELDNPNTDLSTFLDENVRMFLQEESSELNGKLILQNIYKKWNKNMNKNLKSPYIELDQLFFAVELYHLHLFDKLKEDKIDSLRPALQQMMRVRNTARSILRSNDSYHVPILESKNKIQKKSDLNDSYSPFDLIVVKCKMLLRMTSKFDESNISIAPKLLADFVLSPDQPSVFINYISSQKNRLSLTNDGFELIETTYSIRINEFFIQVFDTTLSIVVDNFDGLSAIIQYDHSHKSEKQISRFLNRAFQSLESSYLALVIYKLIKSKTLPYELIGKSIEFALPNIINDNKLFGLCFRRIGYITNIFKESNFLLFHDSSTGKEVPLLSLQLKDYDNISFVQWYIISDVLSIQLCPIELYQKILNFFINFNISDQNIMNFVSRCIYSFYENFNDNYPLEDVKKDFETLLDFLGKSLFANHNLDKASEIVTFFRKILVLTNKLTLIVTEIFKSYEKSLNSGASTELIEFNEKVCAIFAVLGGFIDIVKYNYPVSYRFNRETVHSGILLDYNTIIEYPINKETKPFFVNDKANYFPEPLVPFNWCMFPDFSFIISFFYYATQEINSRMSLFYLRSLSYYLKEDTFYSSLLDEHVKYLIEKLASLMDPFDDMKDIESLLSILSSKNKLKPCFGCNFSVMSSERSGYTTYLSPVLKKIKLTVNIQTNEVFNGYFGLIADCPLNKQYPYVIFHALKGTLYPSTCVPSNVFTNCIKSNNISFTIDTIDQSMTISQNQPIALTAHIHQFENKSYAFKILICARKSCKITDIRIQPYNLPEDSSNSRIFNLSYTPSLRTFYEPTKMDSFIDYPNWIKYKDNDQLKDILMNDYIHEPFNYLVRLDFNDYPLNEMMGINGPLMNFFEADFISDDLVNYIICHVYSKLISQISTIIMMSLVNNGFKSFISPTLLVKLFSYLQIPLEPFDNDKMISSDFPFLFDESMLNENSLIIHNQQYNNLESEMKICLHEIASDKSFVNSLKSYIENMSNDPLIHTLRNNELSISYYDLLIDSTINISANSRTVESFIVSSPIFNSFKIRNIEISNPAIGIKLVSFPFIYNLNNSNASLSINATRLKNSKQPISVLFIDKYSNHWTFGTSFELLLLLKEYYLISDDVLFLRKKLIEYVLIRSPFISIFLPKLLVQLSQESFVLPSQYQTDYLHDLIELSSLINYLDNNVDQDLSLFLYQEKRSLNSHLQSSLAPFFPEFYNKKLTFDKNKANPKVIIKLVDLDVPKTIPLPVSSFILYKSLVLKRDSIQGFPYWEILPIWISITLKCLNKNKNKDKCIDENALNVIKITDELYQVLNPLKQNVSVSLLPSQGRIRILDVSYLLFSSDSTFLNSEIYGPVNLFKPYVFDGEQLYISVNCIEGPIEFSAKIVDPKNENDDLGDVKEIDVNEIHDDFVNEMKIFIEKWTYEDTSEILSIIPPFLLQQNQFQPISEIVLSPDMHYNSYIPPRIVLIVSFILHRINYLHFSYHDSISRPLWKSVSDFISFEEASKEFLQKIAKRMSRRIYLTINRFEAHRMAIEKNGSQSMSIICQMSNLLSGHASDLRSPDIFWHVNFVNEEAIDVGGPARELFNEISTSIFEPTSGLFILSPNGRNKFGSRYLDVYIPFANRGGHKISPINSVQRSHCYQAIGCFLGIVMRTGIYQNLPFAPIVWKLIAGEKIKPKDVLDIDERLRNFFANLQDAKKNKDPSVFDEQFNSPGHFLRWKCENWDGSTIDVHNPTKSSIVKREHVDVFISSCIRTRVEVLNDSINNIRTGLFENIGFNKHQFMMGKIISYLCQGSNIITTAQLKKLFNFPNDCEIGPGSVGYTNFWDAVEKMNNNQRSLLLKFITALTRLPNPALASDFQIRVSVLSGRENCLPLSSTCFNTIYLPVYTSPEIAFKMLTIAIEACQTMEKS